MEGGDLAESTVVTAERSMGVEMGAVKEAGRVVEDGHGRSGCVRPSSSPQRIRTFNRSSSSVTGSLRRLS